MAEIRSSYRKNSFGKVFQSTVLNYPPNIAVELGVLNGYSACYIGLGLRDVQQIKGSAGHLHAYDLWEDYPFKHAKMEDAQLTLEAAHVEKFVTLHKGDASGVHCDYKEKSVDFLHVDISNDGDIIEQMVGLWTPKMRHCGLFLFEGGSEERDDVEWMKKYNRRSIRSVLNSNSIIQDNYIYGTYGRFPSLTVMKKITL